MATKALTTEEGYPGKRAAEIAGITYRQLDYWARTDLVMPSLARAAGSGSRRLYSYRDLLELRAVKSLLDAGIRLDLVREVFAYLTETLIWRVNRLPERAYHEFLGLMGIGVRPPAVAGPWRVQAGRSASPARNASARLCSWAAMAGRGASSSR